MKFTEQLKGYARTAVGYLNERGQTSLTEAAAAIAIGLTLAATLGPVVISVGDDAKVTRTKADVVGIGKAILVMFNDTKEFPVRAKAGGRVNAPIADSQVAVRYLRTGNATDEKRNPNLAASHSLSDSSNSGNLTVSTCAHLLNNHVTFDGDATDSCTTGSLSSRKASLKYRDGTTTTAPTNWKGPYINEIFQDAWGRNFIVMLKGGLIARGSTAFTDGASTITGGGTSSNAAQFYAWVVSAGPDGILQTDETSSTASGDDIGTNFAVVSVKEESVARSQ